MKIVGNQGTILVDTTIQNEFEKKEINTSTTKMKPLSVDLEAEYRVASMNQRLIQRFAEAEEL